jgi:hypothetical protein
MKGTMKWQVKMIAKLSKHQKQDMIDFMGKHIEINPPLDIQVTQTWIQTKLKLY